MHKIVKRWAPVSLALAITGGGLVAAIPAHAQSSSDKQYTVNFKNTDITEMIRFVANAMDMTVVLDPAVKGQVKVISSKAMTREELYNLFLTVLDINGFTALETNGILHVVPRKDARTGPSSVNPEQPFNAEFVTEVIQLDNIDAAKLIPILRPLVPQQSHMAAYANSNAIIVSDIAANIERIRSVIKAVDTGAVETTEVVALAHASAEDVVKMITSLERTAKSGKNAADAKTSLVADRRTNSVVIHGDEIERSRVKTLIRYLDEPNKQQGNSRVIYLEYAKAVDVAAVLNKVIQNIGKVGTTAGAKGSAATNKTAAVEADEATNSLIVTADKTLMDELESMIERLDIRRAQVLVEAIIVELEDVGGKELGIQWLYDSESGGFGSSINGIGTGTGLVGAIGSTVLDTASTTADLAAALAGNPGQVFGLGRINEGNTDFAMLINALQTDTEANILSTPSLLTMDNNEAMISVGQEVPFVTGSYTSTGTGSNPSNPFQTIEREDVGIMLKVTPHINEGDSLVLELEQEVSSLTGTSSTDVITNQRKIKTSVLAQDGETIVLGGLVKDDVQESVQKVPVLGSIPLLGRLFRSNVTNITKTNLLIFIRPTIIRDSATLVGASAEKYDYIRRLQQGERRSGVDLLDDDDLPLLPEWQEQMRKLDEMRDSESDGDSASGMP